MPRELDEDDVRVRPPRSTRPRTKSRPEHLGAADGTVVTVDRGRYRVRVDDTVVTAVRARELGRRAVVVGDRVGVVGDLAGGPDALARVVRVHERTSLLRRTPDDADPVERAVVANAEVLVIVMSLADPEPRPRLVDRCLVAAYDGGLVPLLCLTKADLATADEMRALYEPLGLEILVTSREGGVEQLRVRLQGRTSVLFGQSGVGKSTLVNQLVPDAKRAVGEVTGVGKGRHTTSAALALPLPGGGTVIDTPGVRSFGLGAVAVERVLAAFPDLAAGAEECPVGCDHLGSSCRLDAWVATEGESLDRLASLRQLLRSREGGDAEQPIS
ncbi:MAG TPA: ribosome small subunit-dependent GTPase A [Mycobacteriales bacterium]|nr:ribosome small subunit-dependent GTPase A [Mycobacteriales bacterium]